jgi:hypothetical protein
MVIDSVKRQYLFFRKYFPILFFDGIFVLILFKGKWAREKMVTMGRYRLSMWEKLGNFYSTGLRFQSITFEFVFNL